MRLEVPLFAVVVLASSFARADAIYLQGGRVLEGNATIEGDKVRVELESGRVTFDRAEVLRIEEAASSLDEARQRERKLNPGDVAAMMELADFCRDHDLPARERSLLERILVRQPDHAEARRRLGYVREGNAWVLRSVQRTREQLAQRAQRERELAQKRAQLELEEATLRRDRAETELQQAKAELARDREQPAPPAYPNWYSPVVVAPASRYWNNGWSHRPALHQLPPPSATNPQANYPINGVASPQSHYEDARHTLQGGYIRR